MRRVRRTIYLRIATICVALLAAATPLTATASELAGYRLNQVATSFSDDAFIDWNSRSSAAFELQDQFIIQIFGAGVRDGAASELIGERPAEIYVEVVRFDILSDFEKFFCCAMNEVSAFMELRDAETGEALVERRLVEFDHVGRGGFIGLLSAIEGNGQLERLHEVIRRNTVEWLAVPTE